MGQAKERKKRLGKWYGQPIGPGHPDFIPQPAQEEPCKSEPIEVPSDERSAQEGPKRSRKGRLGLVPIEDDSRRCFRSCPSRLSSR